MSQSKIIGTVEIGTSKTMVLIGELIVGRSCNIIGRGSTSSHGLKKGMIMDLKAASNSVHAAVLAAEKSAQVTLDSIYLSQTGRHLQGMWNTGTASVSRSDGIVGETDIKRAEEDAKCKELPPDRVYIHHMRNPYLLDGREVIDPLHMEGRRLEVGYWSVTGEERKIGDQLRVLNGFGIQVEDMIISSIASGNVVTDDGEKTAGVLVLDIGCGTTDYVVYKEGYIVQTGVIHVGGDHLTNDLSLGLRISRKNAEYLKTEYGKAMTDKRDKEERVWLFGDYTIGDRKFPRAAIYQILNARVEELFKIVRREVGKKCNPDFLAAGAVLTGGTSRLPMIEEVAGEQLGIEARLGESPDWVRDDLRGPENSTVLGLMHYALIGHQDSDSPQASSRGLFRKMARILNLNFS